jgi:polysaccharide biosynthesis transport protein
MLDRPIHGLDVDLASRSNLAIGRRARRGIAWRLATVSCVVVLMAILIYPFLPRTYSATADLLLRPTNQEGATTWDQSVADAIDDNAIQTKIDILRSDPLQHDVIEKHGLMADGEFNPTLHPSWLRQQAAEFPWLAAWLPPRRSDEVQVKANLVRHLVVRRERKSYLIQVGYESRDPDKAAELTNTLTTGFLAEEIGRKRNSHEALLKTLADRATILEAQYHVDEQAEHDFMVSSGLNHIGARESMEQQLVSLSTAVAEAHRHTIETAGRSNMLSSQHGDLDNTTEALSSPMLQRLRERLVELSTGAGAGNVPSGVSQTVLGYLRQGIESETQHLVKAAQNDAAVAQQSETSLRSEIAHIDNRLVEWKTNERHRDDLHRAVQTDLDAINGANQRYMLEADRGDVLQPDVEIVAAAGVPDRPSFPNALLYAAGTIALVILLCGLVLLPTMMQRATLRVR